MTESNMETMLDLERFRELVAAYGADFERWPDHEQARGRALFEASPEARAAVAEERALDQALGELAEPALPAELARRLAEVPAGARPRRFTTRRVRLPAIGWAAAAALGLFVGAQTAAFDEGEAVLEAGTPAAAGDASDERSAEVWTEEDESIALALGAFGALEEEP